MLEDLAWQYCKLAFRAGKLPDKAKMGVAFCLPKTEEAITSPSNIRPITMLEHLQLKLVTKVLMARINKVLSTLFFFMLRCRFINQPLIPLLIEIKAI